MFGYTFLMVPISRILNRLVTQPFNIEDWKWPKITAIFVSLMAMEESLMFTNLTRIIKILTRFSPKSILHNIFSQCRSARKRLGLEFLILRLSYFKDSHLIIYHYINRCLHLSIASLVLMTSI